MGQSFADPEDPKSQSLRAIFELFAGLDAQPLLWAAAFTMVLALVVNEWTKQTLRRAVGEL